MGNIIFLRTDGIQVWAFNNHKQPIALSDLAYNLPHIDGNSRKEQFVKSLAWRSEEEAKGNNKKFTTLILKGLNL